MAIFAHNGRNISYHTDSFAQAIDGLLLQGARLQPEFWRPVIRELQGAGPGRLVTAEWYDSSRSEAELVEDLVAFVQALNLGPLYVVALNEAVAVGNALAARLPAQVTHVLPYGHAVPPAHELVHAIRETLQT